MNQKHQPKENQFDLLKAFFKINKELDLNTTNLKDETVLNNLYWEGLEKNKAEILKQLQAYQRLLGLLSKEQHDIILALMAENLNSAIQIAAIPKQQFITKYEKLFGGDLELLEATHNKALAIRSKLLLQFMQKKQGINL